MSTPHVAGVASLVRAKYPNLGQAQVRGILFATAVDLGPPGWDQQFGWGLPDAVAALAMADTTTPAGGGGYELDVSINGPTQIQPGTTCSWSAVAEPPPMNPSYGWYNDGVPAGGAQYYTGGKDPGSLSDHFTLRVDVTGSDNSTGSATITVYETPGAPMCFQ